MKQRHESASPSNPFCSQRIRPGATSFLFGPGESLAHLLERLRQNGWWGQIVGPHGCGKSALLAELTAAVEQAGRKVVRIELHAGDHRLPPDWQKAAGAAACAVIAVDGYEQLRAWSRWRLKRFCRGRRMGLLVTSHRSVGLPLLFDSSVDLECATRIVQQLQRDFSLLVDGDDVAASLARHAGNMREVLFELYDLYETRRRQQHDG